MKLHFIFIILLSYFNITRAEIRIVRGGGLAEMQVVFIHQNLDNYIRVCLRESNPCRLSSQMLIELSSIYNNHKNEVGKYKIQFSNQVIREHFYQDGNTIVISSKSLYRSNGEPESISMLFAFVTALRLDLNRSTQSFDQNFHLTSQIFRHLSQYHRAIQVPWLNSRMIIHNYEYTFGSVRMRNIYIEDLERTIDLTSEISKVLPCGTIENWNFTSWKFSSEKSTLYFFTNVDSACSTVSNRIQKIIIKVDLSPDKKLRPDSIRVSLSF